MDFKETKAYSLIKEFILMINNSVKDEKQCPLEGDNILSEIKQIILSTPLSEHKGRYANPGMVNVIEAIEKITDNPYLRNSFGNKIRMDFGTGHELNFLCYLYCCFKDVKDKLGLNELEGNIEQTDINDSSLNDNHKNNTNVDDAEARSAKLRSQSEKQEGTNENTAPGNQEHLGDSIHQISTDQVQKPSNIRNHPEISISKINQVSGILREYFNIIRLYIQKFNVEAAGSRGCWSIDDFLLLPYLFGSAENFNDPRPIDCIGTGIFREAYNLNNSIMVKDLCKLSWPSINVGMYKLYVEEVLGRHVVTQHFIYTKFLPQK